MNAPQWIPTYSKEEVGLLFVLGFVGGASFGFLLGFLI
jgi:hypothetical protein